MDSEVLKSYMPVDIDDIVIYGEPYLNTLNSFTNYKVIEAMKTGVPHRVKITLSPKDKKNIVQTVI